MSKSNHLPDPGLALRRARAVTHIDGLYEIVYGLSWLLLAPLLRLGLAYPRFPWLTLLLVVLVIAAGFAGRWIVEAIKTRWVYPRTGYVALPRQRLDRRRVGIGAWMALAVVAGMVLVVTIFERGLLPVRWFPIVLMLFQLWGTLLPIAASQGDWFSYGLLLLASLIGVAVYVLAQSLWGVLLAFFAALSAGTIASGMIKLLVYFWRNRRVAEATDGE